MPANNEIIANGLKLMSIKSKTETVSIGDNDKLPELLPKYFDNETAYVVAYLDYRVLIGIYENSNMKFPDNETIDNEYIQRLRVFNENKELLIWRSSEGLKGRLRIDGDGQDTEVVEACQVLWGTRVVKNTVDFTEITEDRGTTLILPIKGLEVDNRKKRAFIKTRNYVGYTPAYQATYVDCRFVRFLNTENPSF